VRNPRFKDLGPSGIAWRFHGVKIEELRIEGFEGLGNPMSKHGLEVNRPNEIRCAFVKYASLSLT